MEYTVNEELSVISVVINMQPCENSASEEDEKVKEKTLRKVRI